LPELLALLIEKGVSNFRAVVRQTIDKLKANESQRARRRFLETGYSDYDKNVVKQFLKNQLEQDPLKSFKPKDAFEELEDFFNKHSNFKAPI
jgi:hypothetical protein